MVHRAAWLRERRFTSDFRVAATLPPGPDYLPGANDDYSTHLHLLVNWLEIEAASHLLSRKRAEGIALAKHYYRWIYGTVIADWLTLENGVCLLPKSDDHAATAEEY